MHPSRTGLEQAQEEFDVVNLDQHDEKGTASSIEECVEDILVRGMFKLERECDNLVDIGSMRYFVQCKLQRVDYSETSCRGGSWKLASSVGGIGHTPE